MKRILTFTLAFALVAFVFSSCSKDKKENGELKTLEGTQWATTGPQTIEGEVHRVELNFTTGKAFTMVHIWDGEPSQFEGEYVYNKPNITLNARFVGGGEAPILTTTKIKVKEYTFHGTINGKTMTLNLGSGGQIPIVINMK